MKDSDFWRWPMSAIRTPMMPKPVYFPMSPSVAEWKSIPIGCLPYVVDHGGTYDMDPLAPGTQFGYWWDHGYWGEGGTPEKPAPLDKRWQTWNKDRLKACLSQYPPGTLYIFDIEHWRLRIDKFTDAEVHLNEIKFNSLLAEAKSYREDMRFSIYATVPTNEYTVLTNFGLGMVAWAKYNDSPQSMTDFDIWALSGVASRDASGAWVLDDKARFAAPYRVWQGIHDRLCWGYNSRGQKSTTAGLVDYLDVFAASGYDHRRGKDSRDYIRLQASEISRIGGRKKKFVFLNEFYIGNEAPGQPIPDDELEDNLTHGYDAFDGVLLWGDRPITQRFVNLALKVASRPR